MVSLLNIIGQFDINSTELNVSCRYLTSLEGIERFTNLKMLNCENNQLIQLGLIPAQLKELYWCR